MFGMVCLGGPNTEAHQVFGSLELPRIHGFEELLHDESPGFFSVELRLSTFRYILRPESCPFTLVHNGFHKNKIHRSKIVIRFPLLQSLGR